MVVTYRLMVSQSIFGLFSAVSLGLLGTNWSSIIHVKQVRRNPQFITSLESKLKVMQRKGQRFRQAYLLPPCEGFCGRWKSQQHEAEHGRDVGVAAS